MGGGIEGQPDMAHMRSLLFTRVDVYLSKKFPDM